MEAIDLNEMLGEMRALAKAGEDVKKCKELIHEYGTANISFGPISMLGFLIGKDFETCVYALQQGAKESIWKKHKRIPEMHFAADTNDVQYIALLHSQRFSIDGQDIDGNTPLHSAIQGGFVQTANELIRLGANPEKKNRRKETPRDLAKIHQVEGIRFPDC